MGDSDNVGLNELEECIRDLGNALSKLEVLRDDERYRCRSLSVAITEIETGEMWLNRALSDYDEREIVKGVEGE